MMIEIKKIHKPFLLPAVLLFLAFIIPIRGDRDSFPAHHQDLQSPLPYSAMTNFLASLKDHPFISVSVEGHTPGNRSLFLVHLNRAKGKTHQWRVFFYAQQHGDETSGKDALLYLIRYIAENPGTLPADVDLWIMPMVNPDGAAADKRRNANDADLNRDHMLLMQPETLTLHQVFRRILPHVAVDCHEFTRDSQGYTDKGWLKWPIITMDCSNNPLIHPLLYRAGLRWCESVEAPLEQKGHHFCRYSVGAPPPGGELRHSAPDLDDGRNGLGIYQGLSFIIEAGVCRNTPNPNADLSKRVDAFLTLLNQFLKKNRFRRYDMTIIRQAREIKIPEFIPTNYFWANNAYNGQKITPVKVIEKDTGRTLEIPTANFMKDLVIKRSEPTPRAYIISGDAAAPFKSLLERHAIPFSILREPKSFWAAGCQLLRVEDDFDEVYSRYEGRQIVKRLETGEKEFPAGSILVPIEPPEGLRVLLLLEPLQMYGLYQYPGFRKLVKEDNILPVWRVMRY